MFPISCVPSEYASAALLARYVTTWCWRRRGSGDRGRRSHHVHVSPIRSSGLAPCLHRSQDIVRGCDQSWNWRHDGNTGHGWRAQTWHLRSGTRGRDWFTFTLYRLPRLLLHHWRRCSWVTFTLNFPGHWRLLRQGRRLDVEHLDVIVTLDHPLVSRRRSRQAGHHGRRLTVAYDHSVHGWRSNLFIASNHWWQRGWSTGWWSLILVHPCYILLRQFTGLHEQISKICMVQG